TLDPSEMRASQYIDCSNAFGKTVWTQVGPEMRVKFVHRGRSRFPPNTHGFLYLHYDPLLPPLAFQVRFRLTPSHDPALFAEGKDLMRDPDGLQWNIKSMQIATTPGYAGLKKLLLSTGPKEISQALSNLPPSHLDLHWAQTKVLFYLEQPFAMDMSKL
ncbi:hypothetical protein H0H87_002787, partial [Tephrocybe sp. NHM501043]